MGASDCIQMLLKISRLPAGVPVTQCLLNSSLKHCEEELQVDDTLCASVQSVLGRAQLLLLGGCLRSIDD